MCILHFVQVLDKRFFIVSSGLCIMDLVSSSALAAAVFISVVAGNNKDYIIFNILIIAAATRNDAVQSRRF